MTKILAGRRFCLKYTELGSKTNSHRYCLMTHFIILFLKTTKTYFIPFFIWRENGFVLFFVQSLSLKWLFIKNTIILRQSSELKRNQGPCSWGQITQLEDFPAQQSSFYLPPRVPPFDTHLIPTFLLKTTTEIELSQ